jgi:hypothetical protein
MAEMSVLLFFTCYFVPVGGTEQRSLGSTSSQASPASVMQFDSYTTFEWDVYLRETNSVTAPPEYYKQVHEILLKCVHVENVYFILFGTYLNEQYCECFLTVSLWLYVLNQ